MSAITEDELVEHTLQKAWDVLLKAREDGKLPNFNIVVPAQLVSWLDSIYDTQLTTYRATDQQLWKNKRFAIAVTYRMSIQNTVGLDYFMEQMNDKGKMNAIDRLISDLQAGLTKDNKFKRMFR